MTDLGLINPHYCTWSTARLCFKNDNYIYVKQNLFASYLSKHW